VDAFARYHGLSREGVPLAEGGAEGQQSADWERQALIKARVCAGDQELGRRVVKLAEQVAFERGAALPASLHHLRLRMERELGKEGPHRYDVKLGAGGIVDVEFAVQWMQMKHGFDPRVRSTDTETALSALEASGHCEASIAASLREGYTFLRRLEQALRIVHGTSASLIEYGAPGLAALARRMGFRDGAHGPSHTAGESLLERYKGVRRDVRAAYLAALGLEAKVSDEGSSHRLG
jgi:glutamate-ammonia-ligase adenylyltransferase